MVGMSRYAEIAFLVAYLESIRCGRSESVAAMDEVNGIGISRTLVGF